MKIGILSGCSAAQISYSLPLYGIGRVAFTVGMKFVLVTMFRRFALIVEMSLALAMICRRFALIVEMSLALAMICRRFALIVEMSLALAMICRRFAAIAAITLVNVMCGLVLFAKTASILVFACNRISRTGWNFA
jgi:hypothetical protein